MGEIRILRKKISRECLAAIAREKFGDMVKAVVDVESELMAVGGELHFDEEQVLLKHGSRPNNLWGINLYPAMVGEDFVEFDSIINIHPGLNNRSRGVEDGARREKILAVVKKLID